MSVGYQPDTAPKEIMGRPPAGVYTVVIKDIGGGRALNGNCDRIKFDFEVIDGEYKGKRIYWSLNVNWDPELVKTDENKATAKKIGDESMGGLLWALRMDNGWTPQTAHTAYNKPIVIHTYWSKENDAGKKYREMSQFEQVGQSAQAAPSPVAQNTTPTPTVNTNTNINNNLPGVPGHAWQVPVSQG